jgi:hypothetical protein
MISLVGEVKSHTPFCSSQMVCDKELEVRVSQRANEIFRYIGDRGSRKNIEVRVRPTDVTEVLFLVELFWNKYKIRLSPVFNRRNQPYMFTACYEASCSNNIVRFYETFTTLIVKPEKDKISLPKKVEEARAQAGKGLRLSDDQIRERFQEITAKREFSHRRAGFGNPCIAQDGDVDCSQTMWNGPLFYAVQTNDLAEVKKYVARKESLKVKDLDGKSLLFHVMHDPEMIRVLCAAGVDPNEPDKKGFTPMHVARAYQLCMHVGSQFVDALKESGGKV